MFRMVAMGGAGRISPEPLHVMDVGHVDLDELASRIDVVRCKLPATERGMKTSVQALRHGLGDERDHLLDRAVSECAVGSGNCRTKIATCRLETGERCALARSMYPHQRFEEMP